MGKHRERQVQIYQQLIEAVYRRWNETKLSDVPRLMDKYKGQEAEIYDVVVRKYVFCASKADWMPLIDVMYTRFNPSKLQDIDRILEKYKDSEAALYRALCDKYIPQMKSGDPPFELDAWAGLGAKAPSENDAGPQDESLERRSPNGGAPKAVRERDDHSLPRMPRAEEKAGATEADAEAAGPPANGKERHRGKNGEKHRDPEKKKEKKEKRSRRERPPAEGDAPGAAPEPPQELPPPQDNGAAAELALADEANGAAGDGTAREPAADDLGGASAAAAQADHPGRVRVRKKRRREPVPDEAGAGQPPAEGGDPGAVAGAHRKRRRRETPGDAGAAPADAGLGVQSAIKEEPEDQDEAADDDGGGFAAQLQAMQAMRLRQQKAAEAAEAAAAAAATAAAGQPGSADAAAGGVAAGVAAPGVNEVRRRVRRRKVKPAPAAAELPPAPGEAVAEPFDPRRIQGGVQEAVGVAQPKRGERMRRREKIARLAARQGVGLPAGAAALDAAVAEAGAMAATADGEEAMPPPPPPPASLPTSRLQEDELAQQRSAREQLLRAKLLEARRMRAEAMARASAGPKAARAPPAAADGSRTAVEFSWGGTTAPAVQTTGHADGARDDSPESSSGVPASPPKPKIVLRGSHEAELRARALNALAFLKGGSREEAPAAATA